MTTKVAKAPVTPIRQTTQYNCMAASMSMCLKALGLSQEEASQEVVNRVMGVQPMRGAAWEQALACAQHYGCRATLTLPATVEQLKLWTDAGVPVMIAWNPEGRPWSHASVVFDVDADRNVYVADPNIPNPKETVRIVPEADFYSKWYEKFPDYLVRRPACAIEREITLDGKQVRLASKAASNLWTDPHQSPKGVYYPKSKWDYLGKHAPFRWSTPAAGISGAFPEPWRVSDKDAAQALLKRLLPHFSDIYTDYDSTQYRGHLLLWVSLRDNRDKAMHQTRIQEVAQALQHAQLPFLLRPQGNLWLLDDIKKDILSREAADRVAERFIQAAYSGNPDGKPIYDVKIDHGEDQPLSGGWDIMKRLQDQYRIEQGHPPRDPNPRLAGRLNANSQTEVDRLTRRFLTTQTGGGK